MKHDDAKRIIEAKVNQLSKLSYRDLVALVDEGSHTEEVVGKDGVEYQIDIRFFYDDKSQRTIRVSGSIFAVKELSPWWLFWKNVDSAIASSDFIAKPDNK